MKTISIVALFLVIFLVSSCAIGPIYDPEISTGSTGLSMHNKKVLVTKFYKAQTELSYLGDLDISHILESAKLYDMSFSVANHLKKEGIEAYAMKDTPANKLKEGEVMLSGAIITKSIPMEENFPYPGMLIIILIGNILPSPAAYVSGVDVMYQYELVDSSGKILHSVEKSSRVYYEDYYIWGRIFNYQDYEKKIRENVQNQIYDLIVEDFFRET